MVNYISDQFFGVYHDSDSYGAGRAIATALITSEQDIQRVGGGKSASFSLDLLKDAIQRLEMIGVENVVISQVNPHMLSKSGFGPLLFTDVLSPGNTVMVAPRLDSEPIQIVYPVNNQTVESISAVISQTKPNKIELDLALSKSKKNIRGENI